jgi:hypothetical protein
MTIEQLKTQQAEALEVLADPSMADFHAIAQQEIADIAAQLAALQPPKKKHTPTRSVNPREVRSQGSRAKNGATKSYAPLALPQTNVKTPPVGGGEATGIEQLLFYRTLCMHDKKRDKKAIANLLKAWTKVYASQSVRKTSPNKALMDKVVTGLQRIHDQIPTRTEKVHLQYKPETVAALQKVASKEVYKALKLSQSYVGFLDSSPEKAKTKKWVKEAQAAQATELPQWLYQKLSKAILNLERYNSGATPLVKFVRDELSGLGSGSKKAKGLGCVDTPSQQPCVKGSVTHDESGLPYLMSSQELLATTYKVLPLSEYWTKLFGDLPAEGRFTIALCAKKGQGKTTLAMQFAKYFADKIGDVLYLSNEQYGSAALKRQAQQNGITQTDRITWGGSVDLLKELDLVKPNQYQLIIIDSTTDGQISKAMFESYLQKHNRTSFVAILRKSQQGTDMGADANFITGKVDVVVEFREDDTDKFAHWVKNRLANAQWLEDNEVKIAF